MTEMSMGSSTPTCRGRDRRRHLLRRLFRVRDQREQRHRARTRTVVGRHRREPGSGSFRTTTPLPSWTTTSSTAGPRPSSMGASTSFPELRRRSVEVVLAGQSPQGGYVASPTFPQYAFSWLRDGSFIADAMSRAGEVESAEAFFGWVARIVEAGVAVRGALHARRPAGRERWPHRQHDGWGLWLWAARTHCDRHSRRHGWRDAARGRKRTSSPSGTSRASTGGRSARGSTRPRSPASPPVSATSSTSRAPRSDSTARSSCSPSSASARSTSRARQPGRRRPPQPRGHLLRRRRVAAADGAARPRRAGARAGVPRVDRRPRAPRKATSRSSRRTTCCTRVLEPWVESWGPPPSPAPLVARDVPHARGRAWRPDTAARAREPAIPTSSTSPGASRSRTWQSERLVDVVRGIHRHVVRFVEYERPGSTR